MKTTCPAEQVGSLLRPLERIGRDGAVEIMRTRVPRWAVPIISEAADRPGKAKKRTDKRR